MSNNDKYLALEQYILPVLCGNTRLAHRVSLRIFNSYGIISFICGKRRFSDLFDISCKTLKLPSKAEDRLIAEALIELTEKYPDMLPVLVPCSDRANAFVEEFSDLLESRYIISEPCVFICKAPLEALAKALEDQ